MCQTAGGDDVGDDHQGADHAVRGGGCQGGAQPAARSGRQRFEKCVCIHSKEF